MAGGHPHLTLSEPFLVKFLRAVLCALLTVVAVVAAAPGASAAPPTADWSGTAGANVATVDVDADPLGFTGAALVDSEATAGSTNDPRSAATSRNLAASVLGLGLTLNEDGQTAPPDNPASDTGSFASATAAGVTTGVLEYKNQARYRVDEVCLPAAVPYARSETTTAGLDVSSGLDNAFVTGESTVSTITGLTPSGNGPATNRQVESEATGTADDVTVFDGAATISLENEAVLNAQADGTPGGTEVTYQAPPVSVIINQTAVTVAAGTTQTFTFSAGTLAVTVNELDDTSTGLRASGSVSVVSLVLTFGPAGDTDTISVDLLPLEVSAAAPAGGIARVVPAPVVETPADGSVTRDTTPAFSGTGVPGATVTLTVDGTEIADDIEVDEDGDWTFTPTAPLANGPHTVSATQIFDGATSAASAANDFLVDAVAPAAPAITAPEDGSTVTDVTPTVTGTGEPGATVTVEVDGEEVGEATVAEDGIWSLALSEPLDEGEHTVTATQTDEARNTSVADEVTFAVDSGAEAPVITAPADGSSTSDTTPTIRGTAEPGASVAVSVDGEVVGTVTADADGNFVLELTEPLGDGDHTVSAVQTDEAGNVSDPAENEFAVDATDPAAPVVSSPGDGDTVEDRTPTISGTGEPGATIVIVVDGAPVGSVVVGEDGRWSFTLPALSDGDHLIGVFAVDEAGNESEVATIEITVDTQESDLLDPTNGPELADTGGPSLGYLLVGGVLLAVGGTVLSVTRRKA